MTPSKDEADQKIIKLLQENGRESYVEIAKKLKITETAVRRRVKKMIDDRIISKFTIEMGEAGHTSAIVLASVDSATDTTKTSAKLTKLDEVKTAYEITGQYDIATIISASSMSEINRAIDELRRIPGVTDTNTVIILKKIT